MSQPNLARCAALIFLFWLGCSSAEPAGGAGTSADVGPGPVEDAGPESGAGGSADADGGEPCHGVKDGALCGPKRICRDGECVESVCGDGIVDPRVGEACDRGSEPTEGCEPDCTLSEPADPCAGIAAPAGAVLDTSRTRLDQLFSAEATWGSASVATNQVFEVNQYVSIEFVPPIANGTVKWSPGYGATGNYAVRVSRCPHDFRAPQDAPDDLTYCVIPAGTSGAIKTQAPPTNGCPMVVNETYYLNILLNWCPNEACYFFGSLGANAAE